MVEGVWRIDGQRVDRTTHHAVTDVDQLSPPSTL